MQKTPAGNSAVRGILLPLPPKRLTAVESQVKVEATNAAYNYIIFNSFYSHHKLRFLILLFVDYNIFLLTMKEDNNIFQNSLILFTHRIPRRFCQISTKPPVLGRLHQIDKLLSKIKNPRQIFLIFGIFHKKLQMM